MKNNKSLYKSRNDGFSFILNADGNTSDNKEKKEDAGKYISSIGDSIAKIFDVIYNGYSPYKERQNSNLQITDTKEDKSFVWWIIGGVVIIISIIIIAIYLKKKK